LTSQEASNDTGCWWRAWWWRLHRQYHHWSYREVCLCKIRRNLYLDF